jgi:hypothetical protein
MSWKNVSVMAAVLLGTALTGRTVSVGAIRWDVWVGDALNEEYGTPDFRHGIWNEQAVYHEKWRSRLPFFASSVTRTNVQIRSTTQASMDLEIDAAAGALDYWAFLDYPEDPMHEPLELYLSSAINDRIDFCIILNGRNWWLHKQRYVDYFKHASYHKVPGGRPLVYLFNAQSWLTNHVNELVSMSIDQGAGDPYLVTMGWDPGTVQAVGDVLGADAVTAYAYATEGSSTGKPYSQLVAGVKNRWDEFAAGGYKVVPFVMSGWDRRPRADHAVDYPHDTVPSWTNIVQNRWNEQPTPQELAEFVMDASDWAETSPLASEAETVIIYNWNEFTEGGWLCPGYSIASTNDRVRLDFIQAARQGDSSLALSDLAGHWPFDFDEDIYDYSQYQNHAYRDGGMAFVPGARNKALQSEFNGANCFVPHHSSLESMPSLTLSAWVYLDALPPFGESAVIVSKDQVYALTVDSEGRAAFTVGTVSNDWKQPGTQAIGDAGTIITGKWMHVAGVYNPDAGETVLFVNGAPSAAASGASGSLRSNAPVDVQIGNSHLSGKLDEIRLYRSALSTADIDELFVAFRTLLRDSFDAADSPDINAALQERQSGTEKPLEWISATNTSGIAGNALRIFKSGAAGTHNAGLSADFSGEANDVRISVDIKPDLFGGFAIVNFGMSAADGTSAHEGYSFRLDVRTETAWLRVYDNGALVGSMNVTSLMTGGMETLSVTFLGGNTMSAIFNGTDVDFGGGQTFYTGTLETENRIMLAWFHDGTSAASSASFDNFRVEGRLRGGYDAWAELHGLTESSDGYSADPDGDQFSNFHEYSFGGNPTDASDAGALLQSSIVSIGGANMLEVVNCRRAAMDSGLQYSLEYTTNLTSQESWSVCTDSILIGEEPSSAGMDSVTNHIPILGDQGFIRIRVQ